MAVDHNNPQSRDEEILIATIDGTEYNKLPQSRMEELLLELKEVIEEGGGGGGTTDYENLSNQPQVNGETLIGDKSGADLGLVDAEEGKGLSTNDYDDTEKAAVAAATSAISAMQDGSEIDSFGDVEVALLDKADVSDLGTAAAKDSTNVVTSGSTDLVESGAVKDAIDSAVSRSYHHAGTKTVVQLTHDLLIAANEGNVYNITDSGTTTSDFMEGIGKPIKEGDNVGVARVSEGVYKFDLLSGFVDTTNFVQKSVTAGLLKNDGTVNDEIEGDVATLKSGLTNLDTEVNGDATVYPYADVITIEDAVPSNLADCSVKIEPVQDLHGYDKPWVGGAGLNKYSVLIGADGFDNNSGATHSNDNGTLVINCTATANSGVYTGTIAILRSLVGDYSETITYSFDIKASNSDTAVSIGFSDVGRKQETIGTSWQRMSITATADGLDHHFIVYNISGNAVEVQIKNFMFEVGSVAHDYQPYENICPISGHTEVDVQRDGKNLVDINKSFTNNVVDHVTNDGYIVTKANAPIGWSQVGTFIAKKNVKYTLSVTNGFSGYCARIALGILSSVSPSASNLASLPKTNLTVNEVTQIVDPTHSSKTFTFNEDQTIYLWICTDRNNTGSFASTTFALQIEVGETVTPYEPYFGKTYTIALGDTIYGGTVDFDSGVMTVDRAYAEFDGSDDENWIYEYFRQMYHNFYINISDSKQTSSRSELLVNEMPTDYGNGYAWISLGKNLNVCIGNAIEVNTAASFKEWLSNNPLQAVYALATPFTVQLTLQQIQLLKGTNTLYASTGQISVTVNGVSGSIGAVQEQVNELAEDVADVQSGLDTVQSGLTTLGTRVNGIYTRTFYNDTTSTTLNNVYLPKTDKHTIVIIAGNDICTLVVSPSAITEQHNINNQITVALNDNNQFVISGCPYYSRPMFIATYDFRQQPS